MKRIVWAAVVGGAALLAGCNSPHLSLSQAGGVNVPVGGSFAFQALVQDSDDAVLWKLDGPGSLSAASGPQTIYTAPSTWPPPATTATLVAALSSTPEEARMVTITITKPSSSVNGIPGLTESVGVSYDKNSIPTINCNKTVDCYAVLGYIHARDRFFQMDVYRRTARGTISELVGEGGLEQDETFRSVFTNRAGQSVPEALYAYVQTDDYVAPRLAAYTAGVNAWIAQVRASPQLLPGAYGQLQYTIDPKSTTDLPDWSDVDTVAIARLFEFALSAENDLDKDQKYGLWAGAFRTADPLMIGLWIWAKSPVTAYTLSGSGAPLAPNLVAQPGVLDELHDAAPAIRAAAKKISPLRYLGHRFGEPTGSNNWVVDAAHSTTGHSLVANDPHQGLTYPDNFHLSHLIGSEEGLNVLGAAFPGAPVALIGRGAHVGWGDTVVGYDVTDLYVEDAVFQGGLPAAVRFNGALVPLHPVPQTIKVRGPVGLENRSFVVLVSPPHGPIVSVEGGVVVSMRWTGHETQTDEIRAILRLNNATSVDDARQALEGDFKPDGGRYTGWWTGAQNFVLADDDGGIGYVPHACVPRRPWATAAHYPYPVVPVLGDGGFEWATATDGGIDCVPDDLLPKAIGSAKGYLATANADPLGASDDNNPYGNNPGGAPYLSFDWDDKIGFRIARIQEVLDAKTQGGGKVSLDDVHALQADHVSTVARMFFPLIQGMHPEQSSDAHVRAGWAIFTGWEGADAGIPFDCPTGLVAGALDPAVSPNDPDETNSANSAACLLFHTFLRRVLETTFSDEEAFAGVSRTPDVEVRTLLVLLSGMVPNPNNLFCSDVNAQGLKIQDRTCASQVLDALGWAHQRLRSVYGDPVNWRWGRVHTVTFEFVVSGYPLIDPAYQPGPFPRPGGAWTVDVGNPPGSSTDLSFPYTVGGAIRWAASMDGSLGNTTMQLAGIESGNAYNAGRDLLLSQWVLNQYFNWPFQQADVTSVRTEAFNP